MIEEIAGGIKNAMERGATLEQAVQSFISAGYNPVEVRQAAQSLSYLPQTLRPAERQMPDRQENPILPEEPRAPLRQIPQQPSQQTQQPVQQTNVQSLNQVPSVQQRFDSSNFARVKPKSNKSFLIIVLVLILLLLIGGLVYMIFYGKELLDSLLSS